jgi:hypothetical protein
MRGRTASSNTSPPVVGTTTAGTTAAALSKGTRVVRGPDWRNGDIDGGPGRLGTVVTVDSDGMYEVVWDADSEREPKRQYAKPGKMQIVKAP